MKITNVLFAAAALASSYLQVSANPLPSAQETQVVETPIEPKWTVGQSITCGTLNGLVVFAADQDLVAQPSLDRASITTAIRDQWQQQTAPWGAAAAGNSWELRYYPADDRFWGVLATEFDCLVEKTVDQIKTHGQWTSLAVWLPEQNDPVAVLQWFFNEAT